MMDCTYCELANVSKFACCIQTQLSVRCVISVLVGQGLLILRNAIAEFFLSSSNETILQTTLSAHRCS